MQAAALGVGVVAVDPGAHDKLAAVRLADVDVHRAAHHYRIEDGLDGFGHERLQGVAFDGQAKTRHAGEHARMPGNGDAHLAGLDETARRLEALDAAAVPADTRHLTVLDDVDAAAVGGAGKAPGHGIVPRHATAPLQGAPHHGITRIGRGIEDRHHALDLLDAEDF